MKKVLIGVVGEKQDKIYVWSMKSIMDPDRA